MPKTNPYPGLRPFTEKESIFFKGRDLHIRQIIKQLEKNKIVVITGASGDGKSSLVYAGVIPHARAGFFRAEYNNWLICEFRPERTPLHNLSKSLSENFKMSQQDILEELRPGFSSLIKLYKKTPFYIDKNAPEWKFANLEEQRKMKTRGANLFILTDQFEEFFTNPENYAGGIPSEDAYIAVNLLLESASLAIKEDLPVYIVFTMRSDFISQSVSFKGLPEFIGYSQFFVPRLQRNELQQVIEEPARLAGGSIAKRLTETLINELRDGFDQLPIIQYSLSELWKAAREGEDEMDLVHLAKLAGLPTKYLSTDDKQRFDKWIKEQETFKHKYFQNTSLSNVLNTHANILYETAHFYYQEKITWAKSAISQEDARFIIRTAFQSLTKIDAGRAVRNRVTLREITNIINKENIEYETVCGILNIFRLPGNNFIRPYIVPNELETEYLAADTILDITHEALIRNWEILDFWETEEKDNYTNFQDFTIQLDRWLKNNKSPQFLLPLGTLVHFEKWYAKYKPNKYWIAKYDSSLSKKEEKVAKAELLEEDMKDYLEKSRNAINIAEKAKRRRRKIVTLSSMAIIMVLAGFTFWAVRERQFAVKQQIIAEDKTKIAEQQTRIAEDEKTKAISATQLAEQERLNAEQSARDALFAKDQAEKAEKYSSFLRIIAEEQTKIAKKETEKAKLERQKADEQRVIAEDAKVKALIATDSATTLSYLALSRTLALRAQNPYSDNHINLLLAYYSYYFNNKHGGFEGNPDIYAALRYALSVNGMPNTIQIPKHDLVSFAINDMVLTVHTTDNSLIQYHINKNNQLGSKNIFKTKVPVNASFFISDQMLVIGFEDSKQVIYSLKNDKKYQLKGHSGLLRTADKNPAKNEFATGGRDKQINIYKYAEENQSPVKKFAMADRVNALKYTADGKQIITALNNGHIVLLDVETGKQQILDKKNNIRALSIGQNKNRDIMAIGFEDGSLVMIYPNANFMKKEYLLSNVGLKSIGISSDNALLSVSKENKKVDINQLSEINQHVIKIMDVDLKAKNLIFSDDDRLYGLCEDNTIRFWEKSNKVYAAAVMNKIRRDFSDEEWKTHVGEHIKLEKIISK
jgi:energy-coupling factor transporter ATP-binding protein EcfA2